MTARAGGGTAASAKAFGRTPGPIVSRAAGALGVRRIWWVGLIAGLAWVTDAVLTHFWPDADDLNGTDMLATVMLAIGVILLTTTLFRLVGGRFPAILQRIGPWFIALALDVRAIALAARGFTVLMVTHDVEEALLMANRVLVFSPRPARRRAELAVGLPYPRHRDDPRLIALRREALDLLGLPT